MKIRVNSKPYQIKPVSELTFSEFNQYIIEGKIVNLPDYLAVMTDLPLDEIMRSEISASSATYIHQSIFDIDVEKELKEKKKALHFKGENYLTDELSIKSFGKSYFFDLHLQKYVEKKINEYQLAIYTLAIAICEEMSNQVEEVYQELCELNWRKVLPHAFFLARRSRRRRPILIKLLRACTPELKRTTSKTQFSLNRLRSMERNSARNYSVRDLMYP